MGLDQIVQLVVQLTGLVDQELDPGGDGAEGKDVTRCSTVAFRGLDIWRSEQLLAQSDTSKAGSEVLWGDDDQALELVNGLGPADQYPLAGDENLAQRLPQAPTPRHGLMLASQCRSGRTDRVDPIALRAPASFPAAHLDHVLAGFGQHRRQSRGKAARPSKAQTR